MSSTATAEPITTTEVDVDLDAKVPCDIKRSCPNEAQFMVSSSADCGCTWKDPGCPGCVEDVELVAALQQAGLVSLQCRKCGKDGINAKIDEVRPI